MNEVIRDYREEITARIIEAIKAGTAPYHEAIPLCLTGHHDTTRKAQMGRTRTATTERGFPYATPAAVVRKRGLGMPVSQGTRCWHFPQP